MINLVQLVGSVVKDPEMFDTRNGGLGAEFTVAVKSVRFDRATGRDVIDQVFIRCQAWEDTAGQVGVLPAGTVVMVTGQLTQQEVEINGRKERKTKVRALKVDVIRTPPPARPVDDDETPPDF